jgi:hypothetical protein
MLERYDQTTAAEMSRLLKEGDLKEIHSLLNELGVNFTFDTVSNYIYIENDTIRIEGDFGNYSIWVVRNDGEEYNVNIWPLTRRHMLECLDMLFPEVFIKESITDLYKNDFKLTDDIIIVLDEYGIGYEVERGENALILDYGNGLIRIHHDCHFNGKFFSQIMDLSDEGIDNSTVPERCTPRELEILIDEFFPAHARDKAINDLLN